MMARYLPGVGLSILLGVIVLVWYVHYLRVCLSRLIEASRMH
jgi:hypothetical protein